MSGYEDLDFDEELTLNLATKTTKNQLKKRFESSTTRSQDTDKSTEDSRGSSFSHDSGYHSAPSSYASGSGSNARKPTARAPPRQKNLYSIQEFVKEDLQRHTSFPNAGPWTPLRQPHSLNRSSHHRVPAHAPPIDATLDRFKDISLDERRTNSHWAPSGSGFIPSTGVTYPNPPVWPPFYTPYPGEIDIGRQGRQLGDSHLQSPRRRPDMDAAPELRQQLPPQHFIPASVNANPLFVNTAYPPLPGNVSAKYQAQGHSPFSPAIQNGFPGYPWSSAHNDYYNTPSNLGLRTSEGVASVNPVSHTRRPLNEDQQKNKHHRSAWELYEKSQTPRAKSRRNGKESVKTEISADHDTSRRGSRPSTSRTRSVSTTDRSRSRTSDDTELSEAESLWLLSECSEERYTLDENHPFLRVKDLALRKMLDGFRAWQKYPEVTSASPDTGCRSSSRASKESQETGQSKKRQRNTSSQGKEKIQGNAEDDSLASQKITTKRRRTSEKRLTFACPFSKKDPMKHRDCYKYMLTRIRDVKQHLVRCHRIPLYCPRCMNSFTDEDARDNHIRDASCPKREFYKLEGVTDSQKTQLAKRPPSNMSQEDQWFGVFDILFPNHPHPTSPYIDNDLLQDITLYQDFLSTQGPQILSDILTIRGAVTWNLPNEERDLAAFQQTIFEEGFRVIFHQWASQNGLSLAGSMSSGSGDQLTPASTSSPVPPEPEHVQQDAIPTDPAPRHEDGFSSQAVVVREDMDLAHLGADLDSTGQVGAEDVEFGHLPDFPEGEEDELMRLILNDQSENSYSNFPWGSYQ